MLKDGRLAVVRGGGDLRSLPSRQLFERDCLAD